MCSLFCVNLHLLAAIPNKDWVKTILFLFVFSIKNLLFMSFYLLKGFSLTADFSLANAFDVLNTFTVLCNVLSVHVL